MGNAWKHFKTITCHRHLVMKHCFQVGLYRRGLLHDLSKYGWTEFRVGVRYYQGTRSPNAAEREAEGYSTAWMHHKGRNKHHYEYWTVEMAMDRIAACKVYRGADYGDGDALEYLEKTGDARMMHPETLEKLRFLLTMLRDQGQTETFRFIRQVVLKGLPYGGETVQP